jgi:phenylacetate-CoA ligase
MPYLDSLETRDPAQREADLLHRLPQLLAHAQQAPGWNKILGGVNPAAITSRAALAQLPVTRKSGLKQLQSELLPFGGLNITPSRELARIFMSPGPIFDPQARSPDWGGFARVLHALGLRPGHLLQNCFSYHFTPAAFMIEAAAAKIGCTVIPAGSGQTDMQVMAMQNLRPEVYVGSPSFLKIILELAHAKDMDVSSLQYALVSGEALPDSLRNHLRALGVPMVLQAYGIADVGCVAYETCEGNTVHPGMILEEQLLLEIVQPGSGELVAEGEIGEVLITSFHPEYPLIRFATGDLSAVLPGISPCGRTNTRIRGWLGRADQSTKVRAMFVHPGQIGEIVQRHSQILKARLLVSSKDNQDEMVLFCESNEALSSEQRAQIQASLRDITKLRGEVKWQEPGTLPVDGKVIEDARRYV